MTLKACTCTQCPKCNAEKIVCAACGRCLRCCVAHSPECPGCPGSFANSERVTPLAFGLGDRVVYHWDGGVSCGRVTCIAKDELDAVISWDNGDTSTAYCADLVLEDSGE